MPARPSRPARRVPTIRTTTSRPQAKLKSEAITSPLQNRTLGDVGAAARVSGAARFDRGALLVIPVKPRESLRRRSRDGPRVQMGRKRAGGPAHLEFGPQSRAGIRVGLRQSPGPVRAHRPVHAIAFSRQRCGIWQKNGACSTTPRRRRCKKLTRDALAMLLDAPEDEVEELRRSDRDGRASDGAARIPARRFAARRRCPN